MIDPAYLRDLWIFPREPGKPGVRRRTTTLLVDSIVGGSGGRRVEAQDWTFIVPFGALSALDIELSTRRKNKEIYVVWTQGPRLSFDLGDIFHARDGSCFMQVEQSSAMRWEQLEDQSLTIDEGFVNVRWFTGEPGAVVRGDSQTMTQTAFLSYLMLGRL